jgi:FMN phosphatase YigB (HAD superfamily)
MVDFRRWSVLLTDLDNTLYDWTGYFVPSFRAMVVYLSRQTGESVDTLMADFASVFRRHGSVEYSFAIEELDTLARLHPGLTTHERVEKYWDAVVSFQRLRRHILRPYPGVQEMLARLNEAGVRIFAVTESPGWQVKARLRSLKIDTYFTAVYACYDHEVPRDISLERLRRHPVETYQSNVELFNIPRGLRKPNPAFLESILKDLHLHPSEAVYLGDNLHRDISMAYHCGVTSIWARYGTFTNANNLRTLLKVTPWTKEEVDKSSGQDAELPQPDFIIDSPNEVLDIFWRCFEIEPVLF